jgi:MFS family permease
MRAYREILSIPGALKFCAAGLLARSGGAMMGLGIVLMVSALYGSYGLAGALAAANGLAWAIGTAVLSNLVDRYGQRRVMYPAVVVSAAMLAVVVVFALLKLPAWTLFAPIVISGATGGAPGALVRTRWNHVLNDPDRLHTAFALESTLDELTFVIGPVVATALSVGVHPVAGLVAPIVLSLVGAKLFYDQRETEPPPHPREAVEGAPALWRRMILLVPGVAAVVAVNVMIGSMFGAIDVSVVAAATSWDSRAASGVILALFSGASGVAGFWFGARTWAGLASKRFLVGVIAMFAAAALLPFSSSVALLGATGMLFGATVAPTLITANTVLEKLVPIERLTEGLSWMGTGLGIGVSIGSSVSGNLIDHSGYHSGLIAVVAFGATAALVATLSYRTVRRHAHGEPSGLTPPTTAGTV